MSLKSVLKPFQIITSGDMSGNLVSTVINALMQDNIGLQVQWTSTTAVGVIAVEASLDNVTFYALTFSPILAQPASNSAGYLVNLNQLPYAYYRVTYARTSGTGTLNVFAASKAI